MRRIFAGGRWASLVSGAIIALVALAAYSRTFSVPFLFDDVSAILGNSSIRHWDTALFPPADTTTSGRPILNISLALNYAMGRTDTRGYHALNISILIAGGLALFGIVRRTLEIRLDRESTLVAGCTALLWVVHPLLTESVTYIVQRAESLMGLFYLLTLYCFIRGSGSGIKGKRFWYSSSVAACLLGVGTKEVMASAPLIVLLYDRTFVSGGFMRALSQRRWYYSGLAATWIVLAALMISTGGRSGTAGFHSGVAWTSYALLQSQAVAHYLRLCVFPHPLIFDYGWVVPSPTLRLAPYALLMSALLAATLWALVKRPALGFIGAAFFLVLAPTSSIVPIATEKIAEHRMYLPLAAVLALGVFALRRLLGRATLVGCLILAGILFWGTFKRNEVYRDPERLWRETVATCPGNARARNYLGIELLEQAGRANEALEQFEEAVREAPNQPDIHNNLGNALVRLGRTSESIPEYEEALKERPDFATACNNLGNSLKAVGRISEAIPEFENALRLEPDFFEAHYNMANALATLGRTREAIAEYRSALSLRPDDFKAHRDLAASLTLLPGHYDDAVEEFEAAVRLEPNNPDAHFNLATAWSTVPGRLSGAIAQYKEDLRLKPDDWQAHYFLALALLKLPGRTQEAAVELNAVLRFQPGNKSARDMLNSINSSQQSARPKATPDLPSSPGVSTGASIAR